jgi:hypothetical protein
MDNITLVSGPVNVIRLEGKVGKINKVLYVFGDYHIDIKKQRQCPSFESIDVSKYMYYQFKNHVKSGKNHSIDVFFEDYKSYVSQPDPNYKYEPINYRDIYIREVNKILEMSVAFENNKIKYLNKDIDGRKIRLHYADFRNILTRSVTFITNELSQIAYELHSQNYYVNEKTVNDLELALTDGIAYLDYIGSLLNGDKPKDLPFELDKENEEEIKKLMSKLITRYNNKEVKEIVLKEMRFMYNTFINRTKEIVNKILNILPNYKELILSRTLTLVKNPMNNYYSWSNNSEIEKQGYKIYDLLSMISDIFLDPFVILHDLLLLRRFLDKDYITNAVSYTGFFHSVNYIDVLMREFNFKITHVAYSKYNDINKLNNKIKEFDNSENNRVDKLHLQSLLLPEIFTQCVNLTDFPKMFH